MEREILKQCSFTIQGLPKTKSNHNLTNKEGKKIMPKNSEYAQYERDIISSIHEQVGTGMFEYKVICVLEVYYKHKNRHPDLNNMPKSICDGIEKSGIIQNDRDIVYVNLNELYDYDNPRVEVSLYDYRYFKPTLTILDRTDEEVSVLEQEYAERIGKKKTTTKRKKKSSSKQLICSICGNTTDKEHSSPINKSKEVICRACLVLNFK